MSHRAFTIALEKNPGNAQLDVEPITFTLAGDDYTYRVVEVVKEDALALIMARLTTATGYASVANLEDSLRRLLEPASFSHLIARIENPADGLRLSHLTQVVLWLHDEILQRVTGRPTESQSA